MDLRPNGQVDIKVKGYSEILTATLTCWKELPVRLFQSAWVVCGYVGEDHFRGLGGNTFTLSEAQNVLDPTGIFRSYGLQGTPQRCQTFEWQLEERGRMTSRHATFNKEVLRPLFGRNLPGPRGALPGFAL